MNQVTMRADLTGEEELLRKLDHLGKTAGKRVLRKSTRAGTAPMVKAAKRNAPRASGQLKKDLVQKQKFYSNTGTQVGIVGAKRRTGDGKTRSTWILHLVEDGTQAHLIKPKHKKALHFEKKAKDTRKRDEKGRFIKGSGQAPKKSDNITRIVTVVRHPGATGSNFLRKSFEQTQNQSVQQFHTKMAAEIEIEAQKTA